ncbi:MAG: 50S ribosomal protein L19e [Nanoarchaeota archaeon]
MQLNKKKMLAAKTLHVGVSRIVFNIERLSDIKEAITKQDIRDLLADKAILIKEVNGRKTIVRRKTRRGLGSIKKKVKNSKANYIKLTRKLRGYIMELKFRKKMAPELYWQIRKEIRASMFRSKAHLKERIQALSGGQNV